MLISRSLLACIVVLSTAMPYSPKAHARWGNARPNATAKYSAKDLMFLATFKSYIQRIVQIQASTVRKNLICLGFKDKVNFNFDKLESDKLKKELGSYFSSYESSEDCLKLVNEELPELQKAYREMKINLALHKSSPNEINRLITAQSNGVTHKASTHQVTEGLGHKSNQYLDPITLHCDRLSVPLMMGRTNFCFTSLLTILNVQPTHIPKRFSIGPLDQLMPFNKDLPDMSVIDPLTWSEVKEAVSIFKDKYINNDFSKAVMDARNSGEDFGEELQTDKYSLDDRFGNYFAAREFQAHGMYIFSDYPEESAPLKYAEILSSYPVLAFYEPALEVERIDCASQERNLENVCIRYLERVSKAVRYVNTPEQMKEDFGEAFLKILEINESLLKTLDNEFNLSKILDKDLKVSDNPNISNILAWKKLVRFDKALEAFLEVHTDYKENSEIFVKEVDRFDRNIAFLSISGAIGFGVACGIATGLVGAPGLGTAMCLGSLGINTSFYALSFYEYQKATEEFFSNPNTSVDGLGLSLIEFGTLKMAKQSLALDTLLIGFDLNAIAISKNSIRLAKKITKGLGELK